MNSTFKYSKFEQWLCIPVLLIWAVGLALLIFKGITAIL